MCRCWATGTMAAVLPESKEPMSICAPWFTTRSASVAADVRLRLRVAQEQLELRAARGP